MTTRKRRSNGYGNYRHQADACHAYQIAKRKGIPEKQIILFMYDDIAHSQENPIPGKVFNKPDGKDVYQGCKASYTGSDVSAAKFLAVLTGDRKTAQGPVLRSSKRDNVFIYYADHGAPGLIAMPEDQEPVYAKDLNAALVAMKEKDMYNRLVFYLEACESVLVQCPFHRSGVASTACGGIARQTPSTRLSSARRRRDGHTVATPSTHRRDLSPSCTTQGTSTRK